MMKKVFITGASGFVGTHLVQAAKARGLEVHAAVRVSSNTQAIEASVAKFVYPDFNDVEGLRNLFREEQYHYIIHAAAMTKSKDENLMLAVNVGYTANILEAAFSADIALERVVYVSSLAAVGPIKYSAEKLIDETFPYQPLTVYGRSKQRSELMIRERFADKPISVFRPTAVYGPHERDLFIVFDTMNKGIDPYIGSAPQKLSFVYVKDLVDVLLQGLNDQQEGLQFYNISDGNSYSRYRFAEIFKQTFQKKMMRLYIPLKMVQAAAGIFQWLYRNSSKTPVLYPERLHELTAENWGCDISKSRNELNFSPKYNLEQGLTETLQWYKANKWF